MLNINAPERSFQWSVLALACLFVFLASGSLVAQTTLSTGSITGTVTDPTGAVVANAKVVITNTATGQKLDLASNSAGVFNSGPLPPGTYKVQVSAKGFSSASTNLAVQVANEATFNAKLQVGQESQIIEVQGSSIQVNTEQATVQGVLTSDQVENLPVNGRNFLDLAQLEPGVQIQDGQNFDPTKAGYSSISFGGRFGRTARIDVDGVDISDETVGTTTSDVPASAIDEFQISQSSLDLSQDVTSSGAVNVTTKSGTNTPHGEAFGFIRDHSFAANAPGGHDYAFQREQFGGKFGGPIIKNKLFFFLDGERTKQDAFAAVDLSGTPFFTSGGGFSQPFRENNLLGKADYTFGNGAKAFYRYSYFSNSLFATFGLGYSVYVNKDITRNHVLGLDFTHGTLTHSIRFSYLKFQNQIVDATLTNNALPLCCTGLEISSGSFFVGPNLLAPQSTPQANRQMKYDGTKVLHSHTLRYGVSFNHIQGGGFANFYGTAPRVSFSSSGGNIANALNGPFPGLNGGDKSTNPLNYPVTRLRVGNGQGFNTLAPALGFPAGGLGPDNRLGLYVGDSWKVKPNLTVNLGLRYDRDTGRTDSDLPDNPDINAVFPTWGNRVKQANMNFAPQIGVAWDPNGNGKTVLRAGVGMFYENVIYNNVLFDRPFRLKNGAFNAVTSACFQGTSQLVSVNQAAGGFIAPSQYNASTDPTGICGNPYMGNVIPQIMSFWGQVLAGNPLDLQAPNPNYIKNFLDIGLGVPGPALFAPNYKTPVSVQMNIGIQREIRHGMVFSADYLRNIETRTLLGIDINKVGDASTFNLAGAQGAISATNSAFGCGTGFDSASIDCAISGVNNDGVGASMADYAGNGLGTPNDSVGIGCNQSFGLGRPCAFPGLNTNQNQAFFLKPIGRSVYNALQVKLVHNVNKPFRGVKALNYQVAYSYSNFSNTGGAQFTGTPADSDQDFVLSAGDNNRPGRYYGPALLDRTHQLSVGGYFDVPGGFRIGLISHFDSPLASAIVSPNSGAPGEIFRTDFTGDGTTGDPMPGTHLGQFDRGTNASGLAKLISQYDTTTANQATPAGQALITNNLMSLSQLQALGGVAPYVCLPVNDSNANCAPPTSAGNQVDFGWLRAMDLKLSWRHTFKERFTIEPSVGFYNLPNFANFNLPPNTMNGILFGNGNGSINGTTRSDQNSFRVGNGTGVYSLGSYRQLEFGLRFIF
ncbi:MAG TPA: carboxypeptidase regulatory-like domain-containing protein [Candidatus Dormibacteraeota bacterium]|nr:carboxypeptidase regulatory-like domain-containing protein [Candidatus Dormibacteraeota bacterium]